MRVRYKQASAHTGLPEGTLRALVSTKQVPHIRIGPRTVLFDTEQLDAWLAERTVRPAKARVYVADHLPEPQKRTARRVFATALGSRDDDKGQP